MIIIVSGLPGSGKSYFAEHLAKRLGDIYINSDQVRHALNALGKYTLENKLDVYKEMLSQTSNAVVQNKNVVVDATFYNHIMREMFVRLASDRNIPIKLIEVTANENLIKERLRKPRKYSEADYSVYESVRDEFEEITMPHLILQSTNDNLESMLKAALTYIESD